MQRNGRGEGGVLQHGDEVVADCRHDDAERLWGDDPAEGCSAGHTERGGSLTLAERHRLNARTEDLGHIGAVVHAEGADGAEDRIKNDADLRQGQVPHEQLQDERRAAEEADVERGNGVDDGVAGEATERAERGKERCQNDRC